MAIVGTIGLAIVNGFKQPTPISTNLAAQTTPAPTPELLTPSNTAPLEVTGEIGTEGVRSYQIEGSPDRELQIEVKSGAVAIDILHPDGRTPPGTPKIAGSGNYFFPFSGKFGLNVRPQSAGTTNAKFTLSIALKPTDGKPKPPFPDRPPN